jgi:hypothetical protein
MEVVALGMRNVNSTARRGGAEQVSIDGRRFPVSTHVKEVSRVPPTLVSYYWESSRERLRSKRPRSPLEPVETDEACARKESMILMSSLGGISWRPCIQETSTSARFAERTRNGTLPRGAERSRQRLYTPSSAT